jgi:hypothetical protein
MKAALSFALMLTPEEQIELRDFAAQRGESVARCVRYFVKRGLAEKTPKAAVTVEDE